MAVPSSPEPEKKKSYPCLYLDWDNKYDLPDSGVMEVRFKKRSETTRKYEGDTSQSVELEILEIVDVEPAEEAGEESPGEALDRYRKGTK